MGLLNLPSELQVAILSSLPAEDIARALCASRHLHSLTEHAWRAACERRWPPWAAIALQAGVGAAAAGSDAGHDSWRRQYELLSLRSEEAATDLAAIRNRQQVVNERHRAILAEWLCEVSFDWALESTLVFKAVIYLDHYLAEFAVTELGRFQLVGLACLRAAMGDSRKPTALAADEHAKRMDPQRFAYISDDTYSAEEVELCTQVVAALVPEQLRTSPNAKMFLRSFWYRATTRGVLSADDMHVYTLASFLLQLSLLDLPCSGYTASLRAAAALSAALAHYGLPEWPAQLQAFGSYTLEEIVPCRQALRELQSSVAAQQMRPLWRQQHETHAYPQREAEWAELQRILACPSKALLTGAALGAGACQRGAAGGTPDPEDVQAMMVD